MNFLSISVYSASTFASSSLMAFPSSMRAALTSGSSLPFIFWAFSFLFALRLSVSCISAALFS